MIRTALFTFLAFSLPAAAQYPERPVTLLAGYPPGGLVDAAQINDLAYKTPDDYDPFINLVAYYPMIAVRTESPYQSIQELIADARANPGKIRVGSPGEGTSSHLNLEELMHRAGVKMIHVPYAGCGQSSPSLLGGHNEALVAQPGELKGQV